MASRSSSETSDPTGPDAPTHGGLTLARYAEIGALLKSFPREHKALVLHSIGVEEPAWDAARAAWSAALSADPSLLTQWSAAFESSLQRTKADAPTVESLQVAPRPSSPRLARTVPSMDAPIDPNAALPFAPAAPAAPSPTRPGAEPSPFSERSPLATTLGVSESEPPPVTLPFTTPSPRYERPRALTLDQYASLCVELRVYPDRRPETLARYAIADERAFATLDLEWQTALAKDTVMAKRWELVCQQYRHYLASI